MGGSVANGAGISRVREGSTTYIHAMVAVMQRLSQRTGDQSLVDQFLGASQLEVNYVPGGLPADQVEFCLEQAANFVEHVEALLGEG